MEKTQETLLILDRYVPKKYHEAIQDISKTDCYDVTLNEGWLFDNNNTMFISYNIKELKSDVKRISKVSMDEWNRIAYPHEF